MEEERSFAIRIWRVVGFGLLAFAITILAGGIWSALLVSNLRSSPAVPWSVAAMSLLPWLMWSYLGGWGGHAALPKRDAVTYEPAEDPAGRTCGH